MQKNGYDALQAQALASGYQGEWQNYQYAEQMIYPEQYNLQDMQAYDMQAGSEMLHDPHIMTQEEKDRGLGSVFKRDDQRLQQIREKDSREKDPNFVSESYSECYPGYQEYNREVVDSDDEGDLTKMDMGGRPAALSSPSSSLPQQRLRGRLRTSAHLRRRIPPWNRHQLTRNSWNNKQHHPILIIWSPILLAIFLLRRRLLPPHIRRRRLPTHSRRRSSNAPPQMWVKK